MRHRRAGSVCADAYFGILLAEDEQLPSPPGNVAELAYTFYRRSNLHICAAIWHRTAMSVELCKCGNLLLLDCGTISRAEDGTRLFVGRACCESS
jgi:hypothetical protein